MCNILDTAAEELRDLLARFVSFALIAVMMVLVSVIWSLTTCWKLTLVALACTPAVYVVTKMLSIVSTRWESRSVEAAEKASDIFAEGFSDVRTVRSLTLESHFHKKYVEAASQAFVTGQQHGIFTGLCFGLSDSSVPLVTACIFAYGMTIAMSHEFTLQAVNTAWTLLLFSMMGASSISGFIPQLSTRVDAGNQILRLTKTSIRLARTEARRKACWRRLQGRHRIQASTFQLPVPTRRYSPERHVPHNPSRTAHCRGWPIRLRQTNNHFADPRPLPYLLWIIKNIWPRHARSRAPVPPLPHRLRPSTTSPLRHNHSPEHPVRSRHPEHKWTSRLHAYCRPLRRHPRLHHFPPLRLRHTHRRQRRRYRHIRRPSPTYCPRTRLRTSPQDSAHG